MSAILMSFSTRRPKQTVAAGAPPAGFLRHFLRQWVEGFATIRHTKPLGSVMVITTLAEISQGIFLVLFVVYAVDTLRAGDAEVGLLRGVQAIGGVAGGLLVSVLIRRYSTRALVGVGFLAFGALSLLTWNLYAVTTATGFYIGLFIAMGIPGVATSTAIITVVQRVSPPKTLGRVIATLQTTMGAAQGVGLLAAGLIADAIGVVPVLDAQGSIYLLCGILGLLMLRKATD